MLRDFQLLIITTSPSGAKDRVLQGLSPVKGAKLLHPTTGERLCEMNGKGIGHEAPCFDQQTRQDNGSVLRSRRGKPDRPDTIPSFTRSREVREGIIMNIEELSAIVVDTTFRLNKNLGSGLLESVFSEAAKRCYCGI